MVFDRRGENDCWMSMSASFLLPRLVNLLDYADEDAKHNKNYHIGADVVRGSV
jgi:hypothetical protein